MKILMKKRNFVKVEMEGLLGVKVPCLMPIRVNLVRLKVVYRKIPISIVYIERVVMMCQCVRLE